MFRIRRCCVLFLFALVFGMIGGCPDGNEQINDPNNADPNEANTDEEFLDAGPVDARSGHTLTLVGDEIYLFGGQGAADAAAKKMDRAGSNAGPFFNDLWRYNIDRTKFEERKKVGDGPGARAGHVAIALNGKLYVDGGIAPNSDVYSDLWLYDTKTNTWTKVSDGGPALTDHTAVIVGDKIFFIGGNDGTSYKTEIWSYDAAAQKWAKETDYPDSHELHNPAVYVSVGKLHILGTSPGQVYIYDSQAKTWQTAAINGTGPGQFNGAAFCQTEYGLTILGGAISSGISGESWMYIPTGISFARGDDLPAPLYDSAVAGLSTAGATGVLFGGMTSGGQYFGDVYKFQYSSTTQNLGFSKLTGD